ncbi:hypothetical protein VUR80DRAFT_1876 [Thermomyces stellatus]
MAKALPKRPPLTHFLCIPLVTPVSRRELSASLSSFRREVVSANEKCFRIPDGAIRPLGTLHLTLGVMSLREEGKLDEAVALLKGLRMSEILREVRREEAERAKKAAELVGEISVTKEDAEEAMAISLRGLRSMQKASQATTLYAPPVDARGHLHPFCEMLRARFLEAGLMVDDNRPLLLHATIVNTIYVKDKNSKAKGRKKASTLDAENLLDRYEDYVWLENFVVDRVAICKMGAKEVLGEDEEGDGAAYEVVAEASI